MVREKPKISKFAKFSILIGVVALVFILVFILAIPLPYSAVERYPVQTPYNAVESKQVQQPYEFYEPENEHIYTDNCDNDPNCVCTHESLGWSGFYCDECDCTRYKTTTMYRTVTEEETVTKYRLEYKERTVTKYATLFQQMTGNVNYYYTVE